MYESNTEAVIKQRMLDRITNIIDKLEGSLTHDAIAPVAVELAQMYIELDRILTMVFAQTAAGQYLENRAAEFGITRKQGTKATGVVRFTGNNGVIIPAGTQVQTPGGLIFKTTAAGTISGGIVDIAIEAANAGTVYNIPASSINSLVSQIIGVASVTNQNSVTGGTDIETDADLLTRLLIKVQTPATSGNANEYRSWALSVNGIGDAKIFPIWNGNGTVKVVLIDSNKQPASGSLVTDVINYIESVRPIGATVTVIAAEALNIDISVSIVKDPAYTTQQIIDNVTAKLIEYLKSIAFKSNYVSYAQIGNAIIDSDGVIDYSNLSVNGGVANISVGAEQVAVLGAVTVS